MNVFEFISNIKLVPVIVTAEVGKIKHVGAALCNAGLPCAEITFRTEGAEKIIACLAKTYPDMLVGAGTVLTVEQVNRAYDNGAKFIVAPGLNPTLVEYCIKKEICIMPGIATPTELDLAIRLGLKVVKFFPANLLGGVPMIKALSAPFQGIKFLPTGGISNKNLRDYLSCKHVLACGGSWIVKKDLIKSSNFEKISELASEAINITKEFI
ncbi:MAG: 2-dehydro-3-deoxyphosphogluconate aldolase [Treponema sp.]|nr:MAG: 2-dehydro-3-deoxyphosphogluconate aldolase [Treponema sp.]